MVYSAAGCKREKSDTPFAGKDIVTREWDGAQGVRAEGQFVLESLSRSCGTQDKLVSPFNGNQACTKGIGG